MVQYSKQNRYSLQSHYLTRVSKLPGILCPDVFGLMRLPDDLYIVSGWRPERDKLERNLEFSSLGNVEELEIDLIVVAM